MRLSARVLGFLFALLLIFFISKTSFAQTNSQPLLNTAYNTPNNLGPYAQNVLIQVMGALGCQLAGINPANQNQPCLGIDTKTGKLGVMQNNRGLLGSVGGMIAILYTPPTHTADYVRYVAGNFGISKGAYAQNYQGVGLTTITPIAALWITFRNIVYLFFVIIFVLIGLGIMLRVKIDPRTVMTIQNQIPRIIIGIILVTLSFPIAGFLIDIMWVIILVIISILMPLATGAGPYDFVSPFGLMDVVPGGVLGVAGGTALQIGNSLFSAGVTGSGVSNLIALPGAQCTDILCFLGNIISTIIGAILGALISFTVGLIAFFVVIIALLYALFKLWFELLKAYVSILISIVFAPFWIVAGLIPGAGEKVGFSAWIRDMLGNLMAFPAAIAMFFLASIFAQQFKINSKVFFIPPLIGPQSAEFGTIIAFGIIMMTPSVVKMTKAAFKSSAGFGLGGGVGVGMTAAGVIGGAVKNKLYWKDRDNVAHGPAANIGRVAVQRVSQSRVAKPYQWAKGTRIGQRLGRINAAGDRARGNYQEPPTPRENAEENGNNSGQNEPGEQSNT